MVKQVLSTLKEDFEAIGLAPKSQPQTPESGGDEGELDELSRTKTKKGSGAQRAAWRRAAKKRKSAIKKYRKSARGRKVAKLRTRRVKMGKVGKGRIRISAGMGSISNLVGDVQKMLDNLKTEDRDEALTSFANVAIISDLLARGFAALSGTENLGEDVEKEDLEGAAATFTDLASFAADVATALKEGDLELDSKLQDAFKEAVTDMLEGLDIFVAMTEQDDDEEGDEEEEEEECEDCDEEEEEVSEDEDSEDDTYSEMRTRLGLGED